MSISFPSRLAACVVLALLTAASPAVTSADIAISSAEDLKNISKDLQASYYLAGDIDAGVTAGWNGGAGFLPIGSSVNPFKGKIDGKGHVISNLTINSALTGVGMFAYTSGASIKNLGLVNVSITGTANVGGLAGSSDGGTITACYTTGSVTAKNSKAGGLLGILQSGWVANAYSQAAVNAVSYGGGLAGQTLKGQIDNCYSTGRVAGSISMGGLVGSNSEAAAAKAYWDRESSGQATSALGTGRSTAEMKQQGSFSGWDFAGIWRIQENRGYPTLRVFEAPPAGSNPPGGGTTAIPAFTSCGIWVLAFLLVASRFWLGRRKSKSRGPLPADSTLPGDGRYSPQSQPVSAR